MKESIIWRGGRKESVYDSVCIPGIVVTNKGTLLAYAEARDHNNIFFGKWIDWAAIDIVMKRSTDGGETWSETKILCNGTNPEGQGGLRTTNNPVMFVDGDTVHMLYNTWYSLEKGRGGEINGGVFYMKSEDDGLTWSEPKDISSSCHTDEYPRCLLATGPGHGIVLSGKSRNPGMLLVPVWMTPESNRNTDDMAHHIAAVSTLYSLNHGETWQLGKVIFATEDMKDPNETVAVELSDGSVMLNIRHVGENKRRAVTVGGTGYDNWATPHFDQTLIDPICFGSIIRYDENTILFINCATTGAETTSSGSWMHGRTHLTVRASRDDGKTWEASRDIVPGKAGYSDIAVGPDGMIYVLYDIDHGDTSMNLLKFDLDWIYGRKVSDD